MVADRRTSSQLIKKVAEIYNWLSSQIHKNSKLSGQCSACGKCCDFEGFGHKLFVTPPELMYLAANLGAENIKPMATGRCPYNIKGKCSVYEHRFSGCRIFSCKGDLDFQNELSEKALKKFKKTCERFLIPYRYTDLATALNNFSAA
ncbi:MAG: YkgJ family cysteine cluster protein [Sedimentisphaerales bacterium]|nr:YkgJ family cysteine cluster protein [Sedimentisphaerales bacterium]